MTLTTLVALYAAGLASFASPCVLPMLPIYLGVLSGAEAIGASEPSHRRLRLAGIGFAVGLAAVFMALGMGAHVITRSLAAHSRWLEVGAGCLMMLFGLKLLGWLKLPWSDREARPMLHRVPNIGGFAGGVLFGAGFALGWTPCVGPVLGTALAYAASATASPLAAASMLAVYALGLATPLVVAAFAASRVLVWSKRLRRYTVAMQRVTGTALVGLGAYLALGSTLASTWSAAHCAGKIACETQAAVGQTPVAEERLPQGPALVEFVSHDCPVCKRMQPLVLELERQCTKGLLLRVDIDEPLGKELAAHYGISAVPTFVSIDPAGGEVERIIGEQSQQRLMLALSDIRGKPCQAGI